jgi:hypothetical protein
VTEHAMLLAGCVLLRLRSKPIRRCRTQVRMNRVRPARRALEFQIGDRTIAQSFVNDRGEVGLGLAVAVGTHQPKHGLCLDDIVSGGGDRPWLRMTGRSAWFYFRSDRKCWLIRVNSVGVGPGRHRLDAGGTRLSDVTRSVTSGLQRTRERRTRERRTRERRTRERRSRGEYRVRRSRGRLNQGTATPTAPRSGRQFPHWPTMGWN